MRTSENHGKITGELIDFSMKTGETSVFLWSNVRISPMITGLLGFVWTWAPPTSSTWTWDMIGACLGMMLPSSTLWWTNSLQLKMAIEIVRFPIKNGDVPWQNVSSPEGTPYQMIYCWLRPHFDPIWPIPLNGSHGQISWFIGWYTPILGIKRKHPNESEKPMTSHAQRSGRLQVSASGEEVLENDPLGFWDDLWSTLKLPSGYD